MSGTPSCAITAPSTYSTIECMMLCGCTTTVILSGGTWNNQPASITSSPLLTIVAESIVILRPIVQFGCFKASAAFTLVSCSFVNPRNGPPDAVRRICLILSFGSPFKDWKIALCSLSTGKIFTPCFFASGIMICPAVTSVSLLASAISLPASIAAIVGRIPIIPTIAVSTTSASGRTEMASRPSMPVSTCTCRSLTRCFKSFAASSDHITA